ncbi:poly [adp-ribose] polymerase [Anaeramoeba ignava]|uniref:Poly [adp-ribose] polymerase n=1 Tax=Anaeramoeba ignava TaxID=1746090 RepID=A0A9Q0LB90_ANAIG|nr:poly [adp-ribose] polymerase [Anaeramoeba ignava]
MRRNPNYNRKSNKKHSFAFQTNTNQPEKNDHMDINRLNQMIEYTKTQITFSRNPSPKKKTKKNRSNQNKLILPPQITKEWCIKNGVCIKFFLRNYCNNPKCNFRHPAQFLRCKDIDSPDGCCNISCPFSHPNPLNSFHLNALKGKKINSFNLKKLKFKIPFREMEQKECESWKKTGQCSDLSCKFQHKGSEAQKSSKNYSDYNMKPKEYTLRDATDSEKFEIKNIWESQGKQKTPPQILKIQMIENEFLKVRHSFFMLKAKQDDSFEGLLWGFHGTKQENIDPICRGGFASDKRFAQAFGKGTYFARDPNVSVSYCYPDHQMFLCQLCIIKEKYLYQETHFYYIIQDVEFLRPIAIITFL